MQSPHHAQLRRKRDAYRRSQTVAALPAPTCQPCGVTQQQGTEAASSATSSQSQSQPALSRKARSSASSASGDPPPPPPQSTGGRTAAGHRRLLGRTTSSSSVLLSRMRELIREKVVETTVDRSDLAAMERERRQRAVDAFVESLRRQRHRQQQQQQQAVHRHSSGSVDVGTPSTPALSTSSSLYSRHGSSRRYRIRSDPASSRPRRFSPSPESLAGDIPLRPVVGSADVAKSAFREHRSTSEDTSNRRQKATTTIGTSRRLSHDVAMGYRTKGYNYLNLYRVSLSVCPSVCLSVCLSG